MLPDSHEASSRQNRRRTALHVRCGAVCVLGVILLLLLAGCGRVQRTNPAAADNYTVTLATEPAAAVVGEGMLVVTLHDPAGQPMDDAQLAVEANMSHAGMTPVTGTAKGGTEGSYRVPLTWTMAGDWYVDIKFTLADGQKITRRFPVQVPAQ